MQKRQTLEQMLWRIPDANQDWVDDTLELATGLHVVEELEMFLMEEEVTSFAELTGEILWMGMQKEEETGIPPDIEVEKFTKENPMQDL